ncbi:hypothetical protein CI102_11875 [Trichoderma harzianum]|nr:hypothetical protein CI102_11875 [Trichoderma harzianum]
MKIHADLRLCISQPASAVSHAPDSKDWGGNGADVGSQEAGKDVVIPRREKITEAVLKVAAGNEINGQEVLAALLDAEQNVKITDVVIEAAAANRGNGKEVMDLLLMKRGGDVKITEAVLKAAAANDVSGREVMTLLLEKCG